MRERLVGIASLMVAAGLLLPELSAAIHGPACPHHGLAPRAAAEDAVRHAGEAGQDPAVRAAPGEAGARHSERPRGSRGSGTTAPQGEDSAHRPEPSRGFAASGTTGLRHEDGAHRSEHSNSSGEWGASAQHHEDGAHRSEPASCTCVGACHAGGAVPVVASGTSVATIADATTAPAARRDHPHPPAPEFLLPFANAPPVPLLA